MRTYYRFLLLSFIVSTYVACDDEAQDITKPIITAELLKNGSPADLNKEVRGLLNLRVIATDNDRITKIEVFIDNVFFAEQADSDHFEKAIDTRTLADGTHTILVKVFDQSDNIGEAGVDINVENIFLSYKLPQAFSEQWAVLSDTQGTVIDMKKRDDTGKVIFLYPLDYSEGALDLTIVTATPNNPSLWTIKAVPAGHYESRTFPVLTSAGKFMLYAPNRSNYEWLLYDSPDMHSFDVAPDETWFDFSFTKPIANLYFAYHDRTTDELRYYYDQVSVGGSATLDQQFSTTKTKPMTKKNISSFPGQGEMAWVFGVMANYEKLIACSMDFKYDGSLTLGYPTELLGTTFSSFTVFYALDLGFKEGYLTGSTTSVTSTEILSKIDILPTEVTSFDKVAYPHIQLATNGTADYAFVSLSNGLSSPYVYWSVNTPFNSTIDIKLPQFSATQLSDMGIGEIASVKLERVELVESDGANTYDEYAIGWLSGFQSGTGTIYKTRNYRIPDGPSGGRNKQNYNDPRYLMLSSPFAKSQKIIK